MTAVWRLKRRQKKEKEQSFSDDDIYNDSVICDIWNSYKGTPQATVFLLQKNGIVLKYNDGGKKMAVFRIEKNKNYTTMSNYHLRDRRLSLKAKGLLSLILSLPDGWDYSVRGLASICKESPDGIATPLKELEKYGYLFREQTRCSNGRLGKVEYVIYEQPQDNSPEQELPCPEKPYTVKPDTVKPDTVIPLTERPCTETPAQINKEEINTEKEITDKNNYQSNQSGKQADADKMMIDRNLFKSQMKKNISYEVLAEESPTATEEVDELVELMSDAVCVNEPFVRVGGSEIPTEVVRERFLRLNSEHILYVMGCMKVGSGKIHNIHQYLLTALYNAPVTMNHYYTAEVNHDLRGG